MKLKLKGLIHWWWFQGPHRNYFVCLDCFEEHICFISEKFFEGTYFLLCDCFVCVGRKRLYSISSWNRPRRWPILRMAFADVYKSLRNGTLLDIIERFTFEDLQPFLPFLVSLTFASSEYSEYLDRIRCRLLESSHCNKLVEFYAIDSTKLRNDLENLEGFDGNLTEFHSNSAANQKIVSIALIVEKLQNKQLNKICFEQLFEHEETFLEFICALIMCISAAPQKYSIPQVIQNLLVFEKSSEIIKLFVCNLIYSIECTIDVILSLEIQSDGSSIARNVAETILKLVSIDQTQLQQVLRRLLNRGTTFANNLALNLICTRLDDRLFVTNLLSACDKPLSINAFIHKHPNKESVKLLHNRVMELLTNHTSGRTDVDPTQLAQLLAALQIFANIRLNSDEIYAWLVFLTRTDSVSDEYLPVALSALIASPQLAPKVLSSILTRSMSASMCCIISKKEMTGVNAQVLYEILTRVNCGGNRKAEAALMSFFTWVKCRILCGQHPYLEQFFILLSINLLSNKTDRLVALTTNMLSIKGVVNARAIAATRSFFLPHVMKEKDIAERLSWMRLENSALPDNYGHYILPTSCISYLFSTRAFAKYSVPVQDWICEQIVKCRLPLDPNIPDLISKYASSCFPSSEYKTSAKPIPENFIADLFSGQLFNEKTIVPQIIALLFVLSYRSSYELIFGSMKSYPYESVEKSIPIRYLLMVVESRSRSFHAVQPQLFKLCGYLYPFMLPNSDSLNLFIHDELKSPQQTTESDEDESFRRILRVLTSTKFNISTSTAVIRRLEWSCIRTQVDHLDFIIQSISVSLDASTPISFISSAVSIWKRLEALIPVRLFKRTISVWCKEKLNHDMLIEQPILLFRCDDRIFESPLMFSCFLQMLSFYLLANRSQILRNVSSPYRYAHMSVEQKAECDELAYSLLGAQDSSVVQILLEICDRFKSPEVSSLSCSYIHQMFIANPMLTKLVHFQGYPIRLIPIAVRGIPSMHICLEFIHELFIMANPAQRIFAVVLVMQLSYQYKIESTHVRVELVIDVLLTLLRTLPPDEMLAMFENIIPALGRMMCIFPKSVSNDITHILLRVSVVASSRMALSATVVKKWSCLERRIMSLVSSNLVAASSAIAFGS